MKVVGAFAASFVARMKHMALQKAASDWPVGQTADLFHSTADEEALSNLAADAEAAEVRLHLWVVRATAA